MINSNQNFSSSHMITVRRGKVFYVSSCVFISENIAITAAHSLFNSDDVTCLGVKAIDYIIHPDYNEDKSKFENDIGLIVFDRKMSAYSSISDDFSFSLYHRTGFGLREGQNNKNIFTIKLLKKEFNFCMFFDVSSVVGDSGGGVFNHAGLLVAVHSTKEGNHIFASRLSFYKKWITPYIDKSYLLGLQER